MNEASKRQMQYDLEHTKSYYLKMNVVSDQWIIERLDNAPNIQGYIKKLIRMDLDGKLPVGDDEKRPRGAYRAKADVRRYVLKLNLKTDSDIIARLDEVPNKQGYIKELVSRDTQRKKRKNKKLFTCSVKFNTFS